MKHSDLTPIIVGLLLFFVLIGGLPVLIQAHANDMGFAVSVSEVAEAKRETEILRGQADFAGGSGTQADPYQISTVQQLQAVNDFLDKHFILINDIDASSTAAWDDGDGGEPEGFLPIGRLVPTFTGHFNGNGYVITGLVINRPATEYVGLFGRAGEDAILTNIRLADGSIIGNNYVGGLVGQNWGEISGSYAHGIVTGEELVGGLVGLNQEGEISNSYTRGIVTGEAVVGGLVGGNPFGTITGSYATGSVTGENSVGGLVGVNNSTITGSYATGSATSNNHAGGLVGRIFSGTITSSYATGYVAGNFNLGGLIGSRDDGTISDSYWDTETSGQATSAGGTGKTTAEMQQQSTYTGWNFTTLWTIDPARNFGYPFLQELSGTVGANPVASAVTVSGLMGIGQTLTGSYTYSDADGHPEQGSTYQWYRSENAAGTGKAAIDGATSNSYTLTDADINTYLSFAVTPKDVLDFGITVESALAGPVVRYFDGGSGIEADPYQIATLEQLQAVKDFRDNHFILINDIDASSTATWDDGNGGEPEGFAPIGTVSAPFIGLLDGQGYVISGLVINRPASSYLGVFGRAGDGAILANIGLEGGSVTGNNNVGGLVGYNSGAISGSYTTGAVTGEQVVGGLVGTNDEGQVSGSYATGSVSGTNYTGGLAGNNTGEVSGSYASGAVSGVQLIGGLVGSNNEGQVSDSYATGFVTGTSFVGGLAGFNNNTISDSYWNTETSGQAASAGGTGKATAEMQQQATYTGWDFTTLWTIDPARNSGYPFLQVLSGTIGFNPVASAVTVSGTVEIGQTITGSYTYSDADGHPEQGSSYQWYRSEDAARTGKVAITSATSTGYVLTADDVGVYLSFTVTPKDSRDFGIPVESALSGPVPSPFAGGSGTEADPFHIATLEQLQAIKYFLDKHFILIDNIDASATATWDDGNGGEPEGFAPIGTVSAPFTGQLDGQGHVITGLVINRPATNYVGLFGFTSIGTVLANIGLEGGSVTGNNNVGGLAGRYQGSMFSGSYASVDVSGEQSVGGLVGHLYSTISHSYASGAVSGEQNAGGLVGYFEDGEVLDSYAMGLVTGERIVGGLVGNNNYGTISKSYATGSVSGEQVVGGLLGANNYGTIIDNYWDTETSGTETGIGNVNVTLPGATGKTTAEMQQQATYTDWNFTTLWTTDPTRNSGYPYLQELSETVSNAPVASAVTVSGAAEIGETLTGSYTYNDADGHPEQGSTYQWYRSEDAAGTGKSAIDEATATSYMLTTADASAYLSFSVTPKDHLDTGSSVESALFGPVPSPFAGGSGTEADPYQIATVEQLQAVKDFRDKHFILINDIDASSTATWDDGDGGEPEGFAPIGTVSAPFTSQLDGQGYVITGLVINRPSSSYMGLFGRAAGGAILANIGLEGGSVTGNNNLGGLVGYNSGTISGSYTTGAVTGEQVVGGLVGHNSAGTISGSYATGSVIGNSNVGGLVGSNDGGISDSYALGPVTGERYVGGLVGSNLETISGSYALGAVAGVEYVGGLVGGAIGYLISNSYWNTETSGQVVSGGGGTGKTTAEMQQQATYTGWDFTTLWTTDPTRNSGYPFLQVLSGTVGTNPVASAVTVSGTVEIGQTLTGSYTYSDADGHPEQGSTYQWYRSEDASGTGKAAIAGATATGYVLVIADAGTYLSFTVTPKDSRDFGTPVESALAGPVAGLFAGGSGTEADPYQIATVAQLQMVNDFLDNHFILINDIDASSTSGWDGGSGFTPIGTNSTKFTGSFNGDGHTITDLFINRGSTSGVGLFGYAEGAAIENTGLQNAAISGSGSVGGLVGVNNSSMVSNSYITGSVSGNSLSVGGLVGYNVSSTVNNSYSTASVAGENEVGGLVGLNLGSTVSNSYSTGSVVGEDKVGGLVGDNSGTVSNSFWDIQISGTATGIGGFLTTGATGKTTAQMKAKATFAGAGWDFEDTWQIDEISDGNLSYPYLTNNTQDPPPGYFEVELPTVVTGEEADAITSSSAELSGEVTDNGNLEVTDRGFVWAEQENPDTGDNVVTAGTGTGSFSETLSALPPGTQLYVRAYATNDVGTAYGDQVSFSTLQGELTISGSFSALNKVYDGGAEAGFDANSLSLAGIYRDHAVSLDNITLSFAQPGVGTDLVVSLTGGELAGEDAGKYTLSLDGAPTAHAAITPLALMLTADNKTKVYGEDDPELSYQLTTGTLIEDDAIAGTLSRVAGEDAGNYEIEQGDLSAGGNYAITFEAGELSITPKTLEVVAENQHKVYGNDDPELTYTADGFAFDDDESVFTGSLEREAGESAGKYAITQGNLSAGDNYAIDFTGAEFTITGGVLTITADEVTKTYGQADPELTYTVSGFADGDDASLLTGSLSRAGGEDIGPYEIRQGDLSAGGNYDINFEIGEFSITPKTLEVAANALTKTYGGEDPALTYTSSGFAFEVDTSILTGTLSREAGESAGTYEIEQGDLDAGDNYTINFTAANLTISGGTLTVTADEFSKTYGQADPELTFTVSGFAGGEDASILTGMLLREEGESAGSYEIRQGDLSAGENYTITFEAGELFITPKTLEVTADALTKTYGEADPELTYSVSGFELGGDESILTGSLAREEGEAVGEYVITQGDLEAGANYTIDFTETAFTITGGVLTITVDEVSKTYGQTDPELTYSVSGFAGGDDESILTGALTRVAGEDVGSYEIQQGNLSAGDNYTLNFTGATFTIDGGVLTILAQDQTKVYGETDPELTYTLTGFAEGDDESLLTGTLSREEGEAVGGYAITQGDLSAGDNYTLNFTGAEFTIEGGVLSISAEGQTKVYGETDPEFTYTVMGFADGDDASILTGSLSREEGESAGTYEIRQGDLSAGNNYAITFDQGELSITPKTLQVTANEGQTKIYGEDNPALTFTASGFAFNEDESVLSGSLGREEGEVPGEYTITPGDLSAGINYTIDFTGDVFRILRTPPVVLSATPEHESAFIPVDVLVQVVFDQPVHINNSQLIRLENADGEITPITPEIEDDRMLVVSHDGLNHLTAYKMIIEAGAITNLDGFGNEEEIRLTFTTIVPAPAQVALISPADFLGSVSIDGVSLEWQEEANAVSYHLALAEDENFESVIFEEQELEQTVFNYDGLEYGTVYYWRVRAVNENSPGPWSATAAFVTQLRNPQPVFPAHNVDEISIAPFVAWNSEYEDSGYELQLSTSSGFGEILMDSLIQDVSFQLTGLKGGTEYHWRVRVIDSSTSSAWSPAHSFTTRVDPSEAELVSQNLFIEFGEDRQQSASYRIIGLPGVDGLGLDQVIPGTYNKDWRAFTDTGFDDDFLVEYIPDDSRFVFTPGHGFWVFGTQPVTGQYTFSPVTLDQQDGFGVGVHPGWNIISNPYLKSVEWELITLLNDVNGSLYNFDRQFYEADTLKAFEGYYFYNDPAFLLDTLFIPYTGFAQRGLNKEEADTEGMASKIMVEVSSPGQGTDKIELVYPEETGSQGKRADVYHPGIEFSRFGMVLKEESGNRAMLSRKATSYRREGDTYELELKSQPSSELKWKVTYSGLPDEAGILLVNSVSGESFLMQEDETYTMKSAESLSRFTMHAGDENQLEEIRKSLLPIRIELQPNYPNPFNPSTTINYALPEDMQVQLQVFDILGRLVATPVSGRQKAGQHRVLFDGSNLASGMYLYRLQAGGELLLGKMTLIK